MGFYIFFLLSCSSTQTSIVVERQNQFPESKFIVGYGVCDKNISVAEKSAILDVMRQIDSFIQGEVSILEKISRENNVETSKFNFSSNLKIQSQFRHGELIRIDKNSSQCSKNLCKAVAYLDRNEAVEQIKLEFKENYEKFKNVSSLARESASKNQITDFTRAFNEIVKLSVVSIVSAIQIKIISKKKPEEFEDLLKEKDILYSMAVKFRAEVLFLIKKENVKNELLDGISTIFKKFNLVTGFGEKCENIKEKHLFLVEIMKKQEECKTDFRGYACILPVQIIVRACSTNSELLNFSFDATGIHAKDQAKALDNAYLNLANSQDIELKFRETIGSIVPLE